MHKHISDMHTPTHRHTDTQPTTPCHYAVPCYPTLPCPTLPLRYLYTQPPSGLFISLLSQDPKFNPRYCTVLYCPVLSCTILYYTVLYYTVLYCTILYCILCRSTQNSRARVLTYPTPYPLPPTLLYCTVYCAGARKIQGQGC